MTSPIDPSIVKQIMKICENDRAAESKIRHRIRPKIKDAEFTNVMQWMLKERIIMAGSANAFGANLYLRNKRCINIWEAEEALEKLNAGSEFGHSLEEAEAEDTPPVTTSAPLQEVFKVVDTKAIEALNEKTVATVRYGSALDVDPSPALTAEVEGETPAAPALAPAKTAHEADQEILKSITAVTIDKADDETCEALAASITEKPSSLDFSAAIVGHLHAKIPAVKETKVPEPAAKPTKTHNPLAQAPTFLELESRVDLLFSLFKERVFTLMDLRRAFGVSASNEDLLRKVLSKSVSATERVVGNESVYSSTGIYTHVDSLLGDQAIHQWKARFLSLFGECDADRFAKLQDRSEPRLTTEKMAATVMDGEKTGDLGFVPPPIEKTRPKSKSRSVLNGNVAIDIDLPEIDFEIGANRSDVFNDTMRGLSATFNTVVTALNQHQVEVQDIDKEIERLQNLRAAAYVNFQNMHNRAVELKKHVEGIKTILKKN